MSRRNLILIGVIVLLVILAGGFYFWQQSSTQRTSAATARQTGTLTRGELVATVSGAGNISAPQQTTLNFGTNGVPITKIKVMVGDRVKAGDVLAEEDAAQLERQLQVAETNLKTAQQKLADLKAPPTAEDLAIADAKLNSAQGNYDSAVAKLSALKAPPAAVDMQAARASLASAQAVYQTATAKAGMSNEQITVQRAALEKARIALEAAQSAYNTVAWRDDAPSSQQASALQTATIDYESAQANYNLSMADMNDSDVKTAEANLAKAKSSLDTLLKGATADTLASADAAIESASQNLMQAKQDLKTLKDGATQADLLTAQGNVDSAQAAFDDAKHALDQAKLVTPFDGIVATVSGVVGQLASSSSAITIVNPQDLQTQVSFSEVDVSQVKPGQDAQLQFDALNGRTVPGKVLSVSPLATISQGVVNYNVILVLTNPDPAILPGMTTQASIITADRPDVLIAPNRSIRTQGNRRMMTVLFEGREIPVFVQTGLTSDTGTEILGATTADGQAVNLQEGDTVLLNVTSTTNSNQRGGFGGPVPGGGPVFINR